MSLLLERRVPAPFDERAFGRRIGIVTRIAERHDPGMLTSQARRICRTWRSHLGWHLARALGWRP